MDKVNKIFENVGLSEDIKSSLKEAFDEKLDNARTELREEFAAKYKVDKKRIVEAMNNMVHDMAKGEAEKLVEERKKLIKSRLSLKEDVKTFNNFAVKQLAEEVKELHEDRKVLDENMQKFIEFFIGQVNKEVRELKEESDKLAKARVKLIKEGENKINEAKRNFNQRAALLVSKWVKESIEKEFKEFRHDINEARKNRLGRKVFEAMMEEVEMNFFNKNKAAQKLQESIKERDEKLQEAMTLMRKQKALLENNSKELKESKESIERNNILNEKLSHLPKDKRDVMVELVEGVETKKLVESINRYLPMVLEENGKSSKVRKTILENNRVSRKVVTGNNKKLNTGLLTEGQKEVDDDEINRIVHLSNVQ